ncbi:MAG: DUF1036 domain-containing protein [Pseudomonadota bacterium]|nr:DUF1036 domain-containing protein [Pseudomonadota bacterium]
MTKPRRWLLALAAAALMSGAARADMRVCNNTHMLVNYAVGYVAGERFATEGWWTVTPGSCSTALHGPLPGRFVYLYAIDIDAVDVLAGKVSMCVDRGKFHVLGISDCWRRGLQAVNFAEIDTGGATDWTTFLTDPRK